jgi:hypothetical protein
MSHALYGMQKMDSNVAEVRGILWALSKLISEGESTLRSQDIGLCLYGLKSMNCESAERIIRHK